MTFQEICPSRKEVSFQNSLSCVVVRQKLKRALVKRALEIVLFGTGMMLKIMMDEADGKKIVDSLYRDSSRMYIITWSLMDL